MRSALPLALLARSGAAGPLAPALRARWARPATALAAAGELMADKLPATPSRLDPGPLGGRLVVGATTGAVMAAGRGRSRLLGAVLGAAGAGLGAWAGYTARAALGRTTGVPDPVWGAVEDLVAVGLGRAATGP